MEFRSKIIVVVGIIYKINKFSIAQRNLKKAQGGLWEFPGGKVELLEHESCKWITKDEKDKFKFAGADKVVFDLI